MALPFFPPFFFPDFHLQASSGDIWGLGREYQEMGRGPGAVTWGALPPARALSRAWHGDATRCTCQGSQRAGPKSRVQKARVTWSSGILPSPNPHIDALRGYGGAKQGCRCISGRAPLAARLVVARALPEARGWRAGLAPLTAAVAVGVDPGGRAGEGGRLLPPPPAPPPAPLQTRGDCHLSKAHLGLRGPRARIHPLVPLS